MRIIRKIRVIRGSGIVAALLAAMIAAPEVYGQSAGEPVAEKSAVTYRHTLNDPQEAASRPKDYTLDPEFHGFIPIPNTPALIQFNAKPHVDMMVDNKEAG